MAKNPSLTVMLNGTQQTLTNIGTISELLAYLGYQGKRVAVEQNGQIVPRSLHDTTKVNEGDQLEIVVAVGGG